MMKLIKSFFEKETFKNISYVSVGKGFSILLGLATISLSARGLGVEKFGILALFLSVVELINLITLPGFNTILQKSLHHNNYQFYKKAYAYSFLSAAFFGPLIILILHFFNSNERFVSFQIQDLIIYAIFFVSIRTMEKTEVILPALKEFKLLALFSFFSSLAKFLGLGLTSYLTGDLKKSISYYLLAQSVLSVGSLIFIFNKLKDFSSEEKKKSFTKESLQMSFLAFLNTGLGQLDRIVLYSLSPVVLGIFQAGISYPEKLREVLKTFLLAVANSWLSYGDKEFKLRTKNNFLLFFIGLILASIVLYFSAFLYVPLILGDGYRQSIPIAGFMGIIILIKSSNYFLQMRDIVFEDLKRYQVKVIIYRVFYVVLLFSLISKYQTVGVLVTIALSEIVYFLMLFYDFRRNK